ncbi:MAG: hypothetical protein FJ125_03630, partial [Deltaproteobacteria bacterium]|nr:hypothetical protein [Deltaproteobacteria bacterium]
MGYEAISRTSRRLCATLCYAMLSLVGLLAACDGDDGTGGKRGPEPTMDAGAPPDADGPGTDGGQPADGGGSGGEPDQGLPLVDSGGGGDAGGDGGDAGVADAGRGGEDGGAGADLAADSGIVPAYITISPQDGARGVPLDSPIVARVVNDEDAEEYCEFDRESTQVVVEGPDGPVAGHVYYYSTLTFPRAKRLDFRAAQFFRPETVYRVTVSTACAPSAVASFTTEASAGAALLEVGSSFRIHIGEVLHPGSIGPLLGSIMDDTNILLQITGLQAGEREGEARFEFYGGQGEVWEQGPTMVYDDRIGDVVLFLEGDLRWPYFRAVGSMSFEVARGSHLTLQHFELGGTFAAGAAGPDITEGFLIGVVSCEEVCRAVHEAAGEEVNCEAIRPSVCDDQDNLNLMGEYTGDGNDLQAIQSLTVVPADGAQQVSPDAAIVVTLTRAVDPADPRAVHIWLTNDVGEDVPGTKVIAPDGLGASFTPAAPLAAGRYTLTVLAM